MPDSMPATSERAHHWLVDAIFGSAVALAAITVAHAALPGRFDRSAHAAIPADAARIVAPAESPAVEPEPRPLLTIGEPVPGHGINSPFGLRQLPWEGGGRLHEGVDIAAPEGAPVLAVADGVVMNAGFSSTYGQFVELKHATGLVSFYAHMERSVPQGIGRMRFVHAGQAVGRIGGTGTSTGPHLHFEIRAKSGRPLNPEAFIGETFATAQDVPLRAAARFSRRVRVAQVSVIPASKRAAMAEIAEQKALAQQEAADRRAMARAARAAAKAGLPEPVIEDAQSAPRPDSRVHGTVQVVS